MPEASAARGGAADEGLGERRSARQKFARAGRGVAAWLDDDGQCDVVRFDRKGRCHLGRLAGG